MQNYSEKFRNKKRSNYNTYISQIRITTQNFPFLSNNLKGILIKENVISNLVTATAEYLDIGPSCRYSATILLNCDARILKKMNAKFLTIL